MGKCIVLSVYEMFRLLVCFKTKKTYLNLWLHDLGELDRNFQVSRSLFNRELFK